MRVRLGGAVVAVCVLLAPACADDDTDVGDTTPTTTVATSAPPTTADGATSSTTTTTTVPQPVTTLPLPEPGEPCEPGSSDDCVDDAWGDGVARYIEGYAECIGALGDDAGLCTDLDADGVSGYPDSG